MSFNESPPSRRGPASWLRSLLRREDTAPVDYTFAHISRSGYLGALAPDLVDAPVELRGLVGELAKADALDEGSGQVFDPTINAWVEQWSNQIQAEHDARQSVLQQREALALAESESLCERADWARRRLEETERRLSRLLDADPAPPPQDAGQPQHDPLETL